MRQEVRTAYVKSGPLPRVSILDRCADHRAILSPGETGNTIVPPCIKVRTAMTRNTWIIVGIALLIAIVSPATSETKKTTKKRLSAKQRAERELEEKKRQKTEKSQQGFGKWHQAGKEMELPAQVESLTDDMAQLDEKVGLTERQKKKIAEMRTVRDNALERWDKANRKKFDAMKAQLEKLSAKKDLKVCKAIVGRMNVMRRTHGSIITGHERKLFAVLTAEQRTKWNAPILAELVLQEFSSVELSEAQATKITAACNARAKRCNLPLDANVSTQIIGPIKRQVYSSVLTAKQRKEYAATKKPKKTSDKER